MCFLFNFVCTYKAIPWFLLAPSKWRFFSLGDSCTCIGHFVIRNAQADKVNTTHLIFVGRTHLGVFFLWLCYHSSAWWLVSCTSWGQVPIWFWSTFYIDIDIVYPCCCKSQCWDVYSSQNIGGVWRGQFFGFSKM